MEITDEQIKQELKQEKFKQNADFEILECEEEYFNQQMEEYENEVLKNE